MARKRMIAAEFWADEEIGKWPCTAQLLYIGLWSVSDDQGVFRADSGYLMSQIFPYKSPKQLKWATCWDLVSTKLVLYEVRGQKYGYIPNFLKWQKISHPTKSKLPPPPEEISGNIPENYGKTPHNIIQPNIIQYNLIAKPKSFADKEEVSVISQAEEITSTETSMSSIKTPNPLRVNENYDGQHRKREPKEVTEPKIPDNVSTLISYFSAAYQAKLGFPYACNILRDKKIFGIILKMNLSVEEIKLRIDRFFATDNEYIIERQYGLTLFEYNINNFGVASQAKKRRVIRI